MRECEKHLEGGGAVVIVVVPAGMNPAVYCQATASGAAGSPQYDGGMPA